MFAQSYMYMDTHTYCRSRSFCSVEVSWLTTSYAFVDKKEFPDVYVRLLCLLVHAAHSCQQDDIHVPLHVRAACWQLCLHVGQA